MPNLTPEQRRVLSRIVAIGRRVNASPKEIKAAVETGIVESGMRNLNYGDADSKGWRQEQSSLYPDPTNLDASIRRFYRETRAVKDRYARAGDLAAAVQRPAAQYRGRYQQQSRYADELLGRVRGARDTGPERGGEEPRTRVRTRTRTVGAVDNKAARGALIASFLQGGDPRFTAGTGAAGLESRDALAFALAMRSLKDNPGRTVTTTTKSAVAPARGSRSSRGTVPAVSSSGRYPVARRGTLIGGPGQGTHTLGNWQSDNAIDIRVPEGTPMVALQDGVVVKVSRHPQDGGRFAGDQITVRGANGNMYFYAHGVARVKPGQRVRKGQSLGRTGSANGVPHLHFGQMRGDPRQHT